MSDDLQHRRSYDVDAATQLFVKEEVADTRHKLSGDIAALGTRIELLVQTSTREHAEVKAGLNVILTANFEARIAALERKDAEESAAAAAVDRLRRQQRWFAGFFVAVVPVAVLVAPHVH